MPPANDMQKYTLPAKKRQSRARRGISADDYSLPKPYRRKPFEEAVPKMSRMRFAILTFSGLMIAGLIVTLAQLAKENFASPPMLIVAAPQAPPLQTTPVSAPAPVATRARPAPAKIKPKDPVTTTAAVQRRPKPPVPAPAALLAMARKTAPVPAVIPKPVLPALDADVVLITAILMLTPPAEPEPSPAVCAPDVPADNGCAAIHGMKP